MSRRSMHNNRGNANGSGGNNRFRRSNHRGRSGGGMDHETDGEFVSPQQRRHAQNQQVKYQDLARNARQSGDRVEMEYYLQHVEHYTRTIALSDAQQRERDDARGGGQRQQHPHQHRNERGNTLQHPEPYEGEAAAASIAASIEQADRERSAERSHHAYSMHDDRHTQQREDVDTTDREARRPYGGEESEQQRRLRNFRQPRQPMSERPMSDRGQETLPIEPMDSMLDAGMQGESMRRGRGRPRKDGGTGESNSGQTLAGVLPIL